MTFAQGTQVRHPRYGMGVVRFHDGPTVGVRFDHGLEEVAAGELGAVASAADVLSRPVWDPPAEVIARGLGEAIRSVNDAWGVFARSRIALLPHQLWVCRQVKRSTPTRWLVADDVGLGKTIEAGLILMSLISAGEVKRMLVLCPASLVEQWQTRLRQMFDIRLTAYTPEGDTTAADFWNTQHQVVASLHTLRADNKGRHDRLMDAEPWDIVVVDEAHHLNADEQLGPTLGYQLLASLDGAQKVRSMVFFTGTPHRGKNYGFLALLRLLRPDLFDPKRPIAGQLSALRQVMIRNNKQEVTDLAGNRLFQEPVVRAETYSYSTTEADFYSTLTEFIVSGKMYAGTLDRTAGQAVMLVLVSMQKLASSSVAAIRRAIMRRLDGLTVGRARKEQLEKEVASYQELEGEGDTDALAAKEEELASTAVKLALMEDEAPRLRELLAAADAVTDETKIAAVLGLLRGPLAGRSVLLFTEYKATQSLLVSKLATEYGPDAVTFINGDGRAEGVTDAAGHPRTLFETRAAAADKFNDGTVRFLVSTEAAGEGIDLQRNCHTLIHVDLPWNPMRMHQRVGRLNRYGQTKRVEVFTVRNPDTVEARIWDQLTLKLQSITRALGQVMAQPEDLQQLVLGMASPALFREVFAEADGVRAEDLSDWFDRRTAQFGGRDALEAVRGLVGNAARFDFAQVSALIPKLDLPDLKPFFRLMLHLNHRRVSEDGGGLTFQTPDGWRGSPGVLAAYSGMRFDRNAGEKQSLGVGHKLVDAAIGQARELTAAVAGVPDDLLPGPLYVFRVSDRVTTGTGVVRAVTVGIADAQTGRQLLRDWEVVKLLNGLLDRDPRRFDVRPTTMKTDTQASVDAATSWLSSQWAALDLPFAFPTPRLVSVLVPGQKIGTDQPDQITDEVKQ